jgi:DNA-binding MarR family transcriptional regulator
MTIEMNAMSAKSPTSRRTCFYVGETYDMAESMGHLLFGVVMNLKREVDARMSELGLTDAQWKPLWMIKNGRADTAFELAREMSIDAGAMTRMLDRLAAKGLVERVRSETDRRVVHLRITREGDAAAEQVPHVLAAVNNDFLRGFSKQEWHQFKDMCQRMLANAQALQAEQEDTA